MTSENAGRLRGGRATPLSDELSAVLMDYSETLRRAALSVETRRTYVSRVRQFLAWLPDGVAAVFENGGECAVWDYRHHLLHGPGPAVSAHYVNSALAAIDDFYAFLGMKPVYVTREDAPQPVACYLDDHTQRRWMSAAVTCPSGRDAALGLVALYLTMRLGEIEVLDVADVTPGRTGRVRRSSAHPGLRRALRNWIVERADWPAAGQEPALFLNYRGGRLSCRSISTILAGIAEAADLDRTVIRRVLHYRPADSERAS